MTRQQRWAKEALERVKRHKAKTKDEAAKESKYRTLCLKMPALLKQSGVVQSLAFMRARSGDDGKKFCDELAEVYGVTPTQGKSASETLQEQAQSASLPAYLVLSRDLIEISVWFRRFAQSELNETEEELQQPTGEVHASPA